MILSYQTIKRLKPLSPIVERTRFNGVTYGLGPAGYDVRIAENLLLKPGDFVLASTLERFDMPNNLIGRVCDKSTWARRGLFVQNTVVEPGWRGHLTLELTYRGPPIDPEVGGGHAVLRKIKLEAGTAIAQILFETLDEPTEYPYEGKYQDQKAGPQEAILEREA